MSKFSFLTGPFLSFAFLAGCQQTHLNVGQPSTSLSASSNSPTQASAVLSAVAPTSYTSRTDTKLSPGALVPPSLLSGLVGAGHIYADPVFNGNRVARITDAHTVLGQSTTHYFSTNSAGENNPWNYSSTIFVVHESGDAALFYKWNASTMTATRMDSQSGTMGINTDKNGIYFDPDSSDFGYTQVNSSSFFNNNGYKFYRYDIDTTQSVWDSSAITASLILDPNGPDCLNGRLTPYDKMGNMGIGGSDNIGGVAFNRSDADTGHIVVIYNVAKGGCRWYDTLSGQIGGVFGGTTTAVSQGTYPSLPPPAKPIVTAVPDYGTLISQHVYKIEITYTEANIGESLPSPAVLFEMPAGVHDFKVNPPDQPSTVTPGLATGFNVYMCDTTLSPSCTPLLQSNLAPPASVSCQAGAVKGSSVNKYYVIAKNADGNSIASSACVVSNGVSGFNAQKNIISWAPVGGATNYDVLKDALDQKLTNTTATSFTEAGSGVSLYVNQTNLISTIPDFGYFRQGTAVPQTNTAGFIVHNVKIDKSGTFAKIGFANYAGNMMWNIETNEVVRGNGAGESSPVPIFSGSGGHTALGYGQFYSTSGSNGNMDFVRIPLSSLSASSMDLGMEHLINFADYFTSIASILSQGVDLKYWYVFGDQHISYANGGVDNSQPILGSTDPVVNASGSVNDTYGPYTAPAEGEIIGIPTDKALSNVYRFCHNWSSGVPGTGFWASPRGNVSQDGHWYMFSSDMQVGSKGYGVGSTAGTSSCVAGTGVGANCRVDVFMCELK